MSDAPARLAPTPRLALSTCRARRFQQSVRVSDYQDGHERQDVQDGTPKGGSTAARGGETDKALAQKINSLPLDDAVKLAKDYALDQQTKRPDWKLNHDSPTFNFLRALRSHPQLADLTDRQRFDALTQSLAAGFGTLTGECAWEAVFHVSEDEAEMLVVADWKKIRTPLGTDPLDYAASRAEERPLTRLPAPLAHAPKLVRRVVSLAVWLQLTRPGQSVALPVDRIGALLGVSGRAISEALKAARDAQVIRRAKEHNRHRGLAAEYAVKIRDFPEALDWRVELGWNFAEAGEEMDRPQAEATTPQSPQPSPSSKLDPIQDDGPPR